MSSATGEAIRRLFVKARIARDLNLDEAKVPPYELPDPLRRTDGEPVRNPADWSERRREILDAFASEVYGSAPDPPPELDCALRETGPAFGGRAVRRQLSVRLLARDDAPRLELLVYVPARASGPVPLFLGLNFWGNHAVGDDPAVPLATRWMPRDAAHRVVRHAATEASRATAASHWPVDLLLERGYGLATADCGDVEPDRPEAPPAGVRRLAPPEAASWGAVAAWAYGLRRALDALEREDVVDGRRVCVIGHSRLGKAALWAAAQDPRFAMAISNESGCLGAALSRRRFGETVDFITGLFPHWFTPRLAQCYARREDRLPVDQHMLLAGIAPRPLYVASAADDLWADPRGEFLATRAASEVYRFLGGEGLASDAQPAVGAPVAGQLGYHVRAGGHDLTRWDWEQFVAFADRHFGAPP